MSIVTGIARAAAHLTVLLGRGREALGTPATPGMRGTAALKLAEAFSPWWSESGALALVLIAGFAIRLVALGTVPGNITADEADNLQFAFHVRTGTGPGFFGFDWKPQPMYSVWLMAQTMNVVGWTVFGMRLPSAIMSVLALVPFYLLARRQVGPLAAIAATLMLASNLWYLHFSRSGWENVHVALYSLGASYCLLRGLNAVDRRAWAVYWALAGVFCSLGLYGYFAGRLVVMGLLAFLPFALIQQRANWRRVLLGYGIMLTVTVLLFAPQAWYIAHNQQAFGNRTSSVFAFRDVTTFAQARDVFITQASLTLRGFLLFDPTVPYNNRYNPPGEGILDFVAGGLYWLGLIVSIPLWRDTALWWCLLLTGIGATQLLASGTPDGARAVGFAPLLYLFAALGLDTFARYLSFRRAAAGITVACAFCVVNGVSGYYDWTHQQAMLDVRQPAIELADFASWQEAQMIESRAGRRGFDVRQWTPERAATVGGSFAGPTPAPKPKGIDPPAATELARRGRPLPVLTTDADLADPRALAVDDAGNMVVVEGKSARVLRLNPDGEVIATWTLDTLDPGPPEAWDVAIERDGNILVLDAAGQVVSRYTPDGQFVERFGQDLKFYRPRGLATDAAGQVYVADTGGSRILKMSSHGQLMQTIGGGPDSLVVQPADVAIAPDGSIFVSEPIAGRVQKLDASGTPVAALAIAKASTVDAPRLAIDARANLLTISDPSDGRVVFARLDLTPLGFNDGTPGGPNKLQLPTGVATFQGRAYVAEAKLSRVLVYDVDEVIAAAAAAPAPSPSPSPSPAP